MKRLICCLLCLFLSFSFSASIYAVESKLRLSDMSELECLEFIKRQGVDVPSVYPDETTWAPFAKQIIQQVEIEPYCRFVISYTISLRFAEEIRSVVNDY